MHQRDRDEADDDTHHDEDDGFECSGEAAQAVFEFSEIEVGNRLQLKLEGSALLADPNQLDCARWKELRVGKGGRQSLAREHASLCRLQASFERAVVSTARGGGHRVGNRHAAFDHCAENTADAFHGRTLCNAFDEWNLQPGDSILGGIESGLNNSDVFILIWSVKAAESGWVAAELNAYFHRHTANSSLRIVPVILDDEPLPSLVAGYLGCRITKPSDYEEIAHKLSGKHDDHELAILLQRRLWDLAKGKIPVGSPHKYILCPQCGSADLKHWGVLDSYKEKMMFAVMCMEENCKFMRSEFCDKDVQAPSP